MLDKVGGRKLLVTAVCLLAGVAIDLYTTRGLSANLLQLMIAIIGIYVTGNVLNKVAGRDAKGGVSREDANIVAGRIIEVEERIQQSEQYLNGMMTQLETAQKQINNNSKLAKAAMGIKE